MEFLHRVRPVFAVISCGADNFYGHPHGAAIERLEQVNATVLRTDQEGLISIRTDGDRILVDTFRRQHPGGATVREPELVVGR